MRWEEVERERERKIHARHDSIKDYLINKGYVFLGAGRDQMAFDEPTTGLVLKIFKNESGQRSNPAQRMLHAWINYCTKNKDNPFLPKFYGQAEFEYEGVHYWQFRMEKLKPAGAMAIAIDNLSTEIEWPNKEDYPNGFTWEDYKRVEPKWSPVIALLGDQVPVLIKTLKDLLHTAGQKWILDTHKENVMARDNNWPVIVDPWQLY